MLWELRAQEFSLVSVGFGQFGLGGLPLCGHSLISVARRLMGVTTCIHI